MKRKALRAALLLLGLAASCSEGARPTVGTNTNWLRRCARDAECGAELACLCGVCTVLCDAAAACGELSGAACVREASQLVCAGASAASVCLLGCSADADCAADELCHEGACARRLAAQDCAAQPAALLCTDFEGGAPPSTPVVTEGNTAKVVAGSAFSGNEALASVVTAAPSTAYLSFPLAALAEGSLYLRAWVETPTEALHNVAPIGLGGSGEPEWHLRAVLQDGALGAWSYTTPLGGSAPLSAGEWHCVIMAVTLGDAGALRIEADGVPVLDVSGIDALPTGGVDQLNLGDVWASSAASIRVDRVLLATEPVGCWD